MRNPFRQRKKNWRLSALESARLSWRNLITRATVTQADGPVVSMTTFAPRLSTVHLALESIARGNSKPSRLVLWLEESLRGVPLPQSLQRLQRRGLEIYYCEDYGPHKKYYPYVASCPRFDTALVTADDDVMYPASWLRELMVAHDADPEHIQCFRAKRIRLTPEGKVRPYDEWASCASTVASVLHFATGVSGVVYPPSFLRVLKGAGDGFRLVCPRADDVWLHAQALRNGYRVRQVRARPVHFVEVRGTQTSSLNRSNVATGGNDVQIAQVYSSDDLRRLHDEDRLPSTLTLDGTPRVTL